PTLDAALQLLQQFRDSLQSLSDAEREALDRYVDDFIQAREVAPAIDNWLARPRLSIQGRWLLPSDVVVDFDDAQQVIGFSLARADPDIFKPENVRRLVARAKRVGINRLTPAQIFILVLLWLILVGMPLIQQKMPPEAQGILNSEAGTIGVG